MSGINFFIKKFAPHSENPYYYSTTRGETVNSYSKKNKGETASSGAATSGAAAKGGALASGISEKYPYQIAWCSWFNVKVHLPSPVIDLTDRYRGMSEEEYRKAAAEDLALTCKGSAFKESAFKEAKKEKKHG